jgi:hypothetical protein
MNSSTAALHRLNVQRYTRSGRFAAITERRGVGWIVCDLDTELRKIRGVRFLKRLARERLEPTPYMVEIEIVVGPRSGDDVPVTARLIRTLSSADTDLERWRAEPDLSVLPVSPHPQFTREERAWAGEQDGTLVSAVLAPPARVRRERREWRS